MPASGAQERGLALNRLVGLTINKICDRQKVVPGDAPLARKQTHHRASETRFEARTSCAVVNRTERGPALTGMLAARQPIADEVTPRRGVVGPVLPRLKSKRKYRCDFAC
jgi:hypothetical protein